VSYIFPVVHIIKAIHIPAKNYNGGMRINSKPANAEKLVAVRSSLTRLVECCPGYSEYPHCGPRVKANPFEK
jgi:hypothetical protein